MDLGLQGKKAIIVGAARGIGMATAEVLAREGCDLAITARSEDGVKDAVANLGKYGTKVIGKAVNVKKADDYKAWLRSEEHTSELQSLMRISYAVFCLKKKKKTAKNNKNNQK